MNTIYGATGDVTEGVLMGSMVSPATFYSSVYSATAHQSWHTYYGNGQSRENKLLQLQAKGMALSHIKKEISEVKGGHVTDALLLAMLTMAAHSNGDNFVPPKRGFYDVRSPLAKFYDNDYYGSVAFEPAHIINLCLLLEARGGLATVTMPGLREGIAL